MFNGNGPEMMDENRANPCKTCCYFAWKLITCIFSHIILVSLVVAYCILGAFTFESLESGHEIQVIDNNNDNNINNNYDFTFDI